MKTTKVSCGHVTESNVLGLIRTVVMRKPYPQKDFEKKWRVRLGQPVEITLALVLYTSID